MTELDHWHPVALGRALGRGPLKVRVAGTDVALFRDDTGRARAVAGTCPHRGMDLGEGRVCEGRLVCPYHAWAWSGDGDGRVPADPTRTPRIDHYDTFETDGAVFIRRAGSDAPFPRWDATGYFPIDVVQRRVKAPLELVLDNFTEVEHTGEIHLILGYDTARLPEVETEVIATEESVRVRNIGPQKPMPRALRWFLGFPPDSRFVDDWTTRFQPVHTVYDQYQLDADGVACGDRLKIAIFFNPIDEDQTELFVFFYSILPPWGRFGANLLLAPIVRRLAAIEIDRDRDLTEKLVDKRRDLTGRPLGRFDKNLVMQRHRIAKLYRGDPDAS